MNILLYNYKQLVYDTTLIMICSCKNKGNFKSEASLKSRSKKVRMFNILYLSNFVTILHYNYKQFWLDL